MKTKKILNIFLVILIFLIFISSDILGQSNQFDSLIYGKKLELINGSIPMYYSAQCEKRAKEVQLVLQHVVKKYPGNNKNAFKLKLAVIDSSQWTGFWVPYGFFFTNQGWIVIPGDMTYHNAAQIYGFDNFSDILLENLKRHSKTPDDLITDMLYNFIIIHEIGHYYIKVILTASPPDRWTNELMASYFTTDYLYQNDREALKTYDIFTKTYAKEYEPKYRTLLDFNLKYASVGLENYFWYHCMFQPMIEDIYSKYKGGFMDTFTVAFPHKDEAVEYSQEEILEIIDKLTQGRATKWIKKMESTSE